MVATLSWKPLSPLWIGTYWIGWRGHRDMSLTELQADAIYIDALLYWFEQGSNFTEIALWYGHWNASRLLAAAIEKSDITREDLFITHSLYPRDFLSTADIDADINAMHDIFSTDVFDSTLITQSLCHKFWYDYVVTLLHSLLASGRTRFVSLSNASKSFIYVMKQEFWDSLFAHETHLSFESRINQDVWVFDRCSELGIENIIWRPLRRNLTTGKNRPLLRELSEKHKKTMNQIVLNRIVYKWYKPMVMSSRITHIQENIDATTFTMSDADYALLDAFRIQDMKIPEIDRDHSGRGISMASFCIDIEKYL